MNKFLSSNPANIKHTNKMKTTIATVTLIISLFGARLTAADATPAAASVEQQFQQADVQLAIEQYKKFRMAAFDLALKFETEGAHSDEQQEQLKRRCAELQARADDLRAMTIRTAALNSTTTR
jgi:hypothetical protein